jgi:hypothetical protein
MHEDNEWIYEKWEEINARVNKAQEDLNEAERVANQLLIDIQCLTIMFEEDLL